MRIGADEFRLIYDPSVGENEPWYINDHTIFRDLGGTWHLVGCTSRHPTTRGTGRAIATTRWSSTVCTPAIRWWGGSATDG